MGEFVMRLLTDKEARRLLDAAAKISAVVEPLEARIAQLEVQIAAIGGQPSPQVAPLEARIARLERVEGAARAAGATQ
jgi:outer membrane murein-binding lipoprotein Lpp